MEVRTVDINTIATTNDNKQYIVVKIGSEQYGIDISFVDNIVRLQKITRVPKAQKYFKGIINLRGEVVPVMSLRLKMCLDNDEFTDKSRIIILRVDQRGLLGIMVDEVKEVVTLSSTQIDKYNPDSKDEQSTYIKGVGKHDNQLISLLDIFSIVEDHETE
ncbi:MAG: purine-binding chemotaxis protein CheW [Lachnospiraceae bacterium]|jgi:purine-binding chemotaxis protein CheW|nr:purine-binding chemotaxis protein CheW [Lachnospiraceae bacterium]